MLQDKDASRATAQRGVAEDDLTPVSDHGVNWHIRFLNAWAAYVYDPAKTWSLRSTAYFRSATVLDDTIPVIELPTPDSPGRQVRYYRPNDLLGIETQFRWAPGARWRFSFGLVLEQEHLAETYSITESGAADQRPPATSRPKMLSNRLFSVYGQSQTSLSRTVDLFLGVRHDGSSYYGAVTTPRLGLVFNRGKLTVKALYMEAFRAPKPWDYTDGSGNPDLRPEKNRSFEVAGGWSISPSLRFDLSAYRNRLSNLLTRVDVGDSFRWDNSGALMTDGCEAGLEYRWGRVRAYLNYTYTRSLDMQDDQVPEISPQGANMGVLYALTPRLSVSLRGQYLGARRNSGIIPTTGNDRIDEAVVLHTTLTLRLSRGIDLQVAVNNLLDARYYHPSNLPASRFRQPQRTVRISAGYSF